MVGTSGHFERILIIGARSGQARLLASGLVDFSAFAAHCALLLLLVFHLGPLEITLEHWFEWSWNYEGQRVDSEPRWPGALDRGCGR
jgi:hypothetical protein